jgi:hypothetical protein
MSEQNPLARLVLFMICLAIAGSVVAGMHYTFIDLPAQDALRAPTNSRADNCPEWCKEYAAGDMQKDISCQIKYCSHWGPMGPS